MIYGSVRSHLPWRVSFPASSVLQRFSLELLQFKQAPLSTTHQLRESISVNDFKDPSQGNCIVGV
jgi:hypothetical protein